MKKINYCKNCGERIIDGEYCPICGEKINNGGVKMDKNRRTRKILLVILGITIIAGVLMVGTALLNHTQTVQITDTASLEMPVGNGIKGEIVNGTNIHQVTNGKGVIVMAYNSKESNLAGAFGFAIVKEMAVGSRFNDDQIYETTVNGSKVYSIATRNDTTHDNILISTHSKEDTMKIYNSIKYNTSNFNNTTNKTADNSTISTSNQQQSSNQQSSNPQSSNSANNKDISSRTYADMGRDADAHENKEKANELNSHIVGHDDKGGAYYSDGSYSPPKL